MSKPPYIDLGGPGGYPEDYRIGLIGRRVQGGERVGVLLEDENVKIERYVAKLAKRFPAVELTARTPFSAGIVILTFERRKS